MKHSEYQKLIHLAYTEGQLIPASNMDDIFNELGEGEILALKRINPRDLKFHQCYFVFLNYIYKYMPESFKTKVKSNKFYRWLQGLKKEYSILYTYSDSTQLIEYNSISFGRMNQVEFKAFINEQIPFIYSDVIGKLYDEKTTNSIIETIEEDFLKFFSKLFKKE